MHKWGLAPSPNCECGASEQTADHVLTVCPIHRASHGARGLTVLDDENRCWLNNTLPASDSGSSAFWKSKRKNPRPQSCLCLTWMGCPSNDNDDDDEHQSVSYHDVPASDFVNQNCSDISIPPVSENEVQTVYTDKPEPDSLSQDNPVVCSVPLTQVQKFNEISLQFLL